ncbi:MAG: helix-turn-helix domain-containing protein [Candidatus Thiodiazotropha sp. (ex Ctena orbiculata)]|nr:helix-turn-helix domain-containing protein [Candidatus Thiodiazotropha taylori]MBT2997405.1 helix-turn-helix domain-containing protein [Candidatus Thiodiazotropha taylori]MBT3001078.1 helix-turn-helix domain-containing protein [Candidatus Thiodiazotropha taylori]MBV2111926.1 helix-turn-helix domain-containing protein [Candidatus Thiodiazotropha taylori]
MSKEDIANRLRSAREMAGLSQGQAAKKLGFHRPTISEIEAGRRNVKSDELTQFAKLYGVEISWLTEGKVSEDKIDKKILAAARNLSSMKDEDIEKLINTIKMIKSSGGKDG